MDGDDLDAFFDDVENAVKEVQQDEEKEGEVKTQREAEQAVEGEPEEEPRPAKRVKVVAASSGAVRNIIVTSSSSAVAPIVSVAPSAATAIAALSSPSVSVAAQPPPPPPPPPNNLQYSGVGASSTAHNNDANKKAHVRSAAGQTWSDPTLTQWPENDFRLFVGNLAKDLKDHDLAHHFSKYPSFVMARIMYNKSDGKSRGYGFVSVLDPKDCANAIREMNQSWLGSRPIQVKRSDWKDREWKEVQKKKKVDGRNKKKQFGI